MTDPQNTTSTTQPFTDSDAVRVDGAYQQIVKATVVQLTDLEKNDAVIRAAAVNYTAQDASAAIHKSLALRPRNIDPDEKKAENTAKKTALQAELDLKMTVAKALEQSGQLEKIKQISNDLKLDPETVVTMMSNAITNKARQTESADTIRELRHDETPVPPQNLPGKPGRTQQRT